MHQEAQVHAQTIITGSSVEPVEPVLNHSRNSLLNFIWEKFLGIIRHHEFRNRIKMLPTSGPSKTALKIGGIQTPRARTCI